MNIFVFDNTFEGLLTSVFEAYSRRVFPDALSPEGEPLPLFHDEVFTVITEEEKARQSTGREFLLQTTPYALRLFFFGDYRKDFIMK